jgi:diaminopimelate epimerase
MRICDRHLGVGADGVLLVAGTPSGYRMDVINADGSRAETCGNGLRCVALRLAHRGQVRATSGGSGDEGESFTITTEAGDHVCRVLDAGRLGTVDVAMRPASFVPTDVPVASAERLVDAGFALAGGSLRLTAVSVGNPHAVTFDDVGEQRLALGPAIERDARFPEGVNVGFARAHGAGHIDLAVWERGAGWTRACGSGACAAAAAAVETGRTRRGEPIEVRLPGGALRIVVGAPGAAIHMTGPARHVFDGELEL